MTPPDSRRRSHPDQYATVLIVTLLPAKQLFSFTRSHLLYEFPIAMPPGRPNLSQSQYLSGFRVDQVHLRARCAGDGFISLSFAFGWIVGDPALNVQGHIGASVKKCGHPAR